MVSLWETGLKWLLICLCISVATLGLLGGTAWRLRAESPLELELSLKISETVFILWRLDIKS